MPKSCFLDFTVRIFLSVFCFSPLIITNAGAAAVGELHAFTLSGPAAFSEQFPDKPGEDTAFMGAGGEKLIISRTFPEGCEILPPGRLRFEARALAFDRAALLLLEPPYFLDIDAYRIYVSANQPGGEGASHYFELAAILEEHEIEFSHDGLTNFIEYYYIVTAIDRKGSEYAVSRRIARAVPGTPERGYLDEAAGR